MIPREIMLKVLGQLPDNVLLQALATTGSLNSTGEVSQVGRNTMDDQMRQNDPQLAALSYDEGRDGIRPWGKRTIERGDDDRPDLEGKSYIVPKQDMARPPAMIPHDQAEDAYSRPGGV